MLSLEELFVWCYVHAEGIWAITLQGDGRNLPGKEADWAFLKVAVLDSADLEAVQARQILADRGLCCFAPIGGYIMDQQDGG